MPIQLSGSLVITGSITTTGVITMSGSIASASYSSNSDLLQGTGSVGFATTASLLAVSSSQQQISASLLNVIAIGATTGSNSFRADQSITGSLVVSSTITAQTLVVQTVTSSIVYSSGSNIFGSDLNSRQTFTGSLNATGSSHSIFGNVGIGTTAPFEIATTNLSVNGASAAVQLGYNGTRVAQFYADNAEVRLYAVANYPLKFGTNDTERMRITNSGNVGIGTGTPLSAFHANCCVAGGATTTVARFGVQDSTGYGTTSPAIELTGTNIGLCFTIGKIEGINDANSGGSMAFSTGLCALTVLERMRITNSGNVGIGTTTPCTTLHTTIQTCYGTNGTVANSYPVATFSQCDCGAGARGLQIGVPTGGVNSPVFLKISNTGARFSIIDQSNCENFTISGVNVGIVCTTPGVSLVIGGTDALKLPTGTTAQRPTGAAGLVRMNTTTGQPEWYNTATSTWASFNQDVNNYLVEYLLVGGGGGGGYDNGAGGGAGGFVLDCGLSVSRCASYSVIVGAGGGIGGIGGHGNASCFNGVVALGGGGGGGQGYIGDDGGSGGGSMYYPIGAIRGGFGTIGQGFEGGCFTTLSSPWLGSGGGGASQRGFDGPFNGMGGAGKPSTLLGNTCYYAGGGNGSGDAPGCQTQPLGGGGIAGNPTGGNGSANSGGGGGGGINGDAYGGSGGSGIVIIRYPGCQRGTGGTICSYCGTTIHVFTSSGTFVA